ncbi:GNAT family N-acetyltransferase [Paenibacillus alkalitolerans]|uniref:GNAT family N-acetyltransferase n=1 Tax=Paenibacillus alkalitolerans TaxID=2799335 RepID=UPI0018F34AF5|nr:N-acetyltransferase [Paenibacillus alkalitolerans]
MEYVIRREDWRDYARIAELNAEAFDYGAGMAEVSLIDALRRRRLYMPELSLVAKAEGFVIGHIMFSLCHVRIGGKRFRAALLGPVAVAPQLQKQGVGSALIEEGHRILEEIGVNVGFLLGHSNYYPRFGYRTRMFGSCRLQVTSQDLPAAEAASPITERRVARSDLAGLLRMWELWYGDVDMSLEVGGDLADWFSPDKRFRSVVLEQEGAAVGYVKYRADRPHSPEMVLARDGEYMLRVLGHLASLSREPLSLPLHPLSRAVREQLRLSYESQTDLWEAAMMRTFGSGSAEADAYMDEVRDGRRLPGLMVWPAAFDFGS